MTSRREIGAIAFFVALLLAASFALFRERDGESARRPVPLVRSSGGEPAVRPLAAPPSAESAPATSADVTRRIRGRIVAGEAPLAGARVGLALIRGALPEGDEPPRGRPLAARALERGRLPVEAR